MSYPCTTKERKKERKKREREREKRKREREREREREVLRAMLAAGGAAAIEIEVKITESFARHSLAVGAAHPVSTRAVAYTKHRKQLRKAGYGK